MWKQRVLWVALIALAAVAGLVLVDAAKFPDDSLFARIRTHHPSQNTNTASTGVETNTENVNVATNTNTAAAVGEAYRNTVLGFGLQLPVGWSVDQAHSTTEETVFTDGMLTDAREAITVTRTDQTLDQWAATYAGETGYRVTDYTLDHMAGKRVRYSGIGADYIGVKFDEQLYIVTVGQMADNGMLASIYFIP